MPETKANNRLSGIPAYHVHGADGRGVPAVGARTARRPKRVDTQIAAASASASDAGADPAVRVQHISNAQQCARSMHIPHAQTPMLRHPTRAALTPQPIRSLQDASAAGGFAGEATRRRVRVQHI